MIRRFPKTAVIAASAVALAGIAAGGVLATSSSGTPTTQTARLSASNTTKAYGSPIAGRHSLLISVDGLHASDLAQYVAQNPNSWLAWLSKRGTTYPKALTTFPSDSFPGMVGLVTGGTPKQTGIYYDVSYNRALYAPGSNCTGKPGTVVAYDESLDFSTDNLSGTSDPTKGFDASAINPANLPLVKSGSTCTPVYPNNYLLTNTVFEVAHNAGLYTAWSDKHPSYQILEGPDSLNPSGTPTIDDLYTPEINSTASATNKLTVPFGPDKGTVINGGGDFTQSVDAAMAYDNTKVTAVLNEINGLTSRGGTPPGGKKVPSILGMNFQAVSVGQKVTNGGYYNNGTTFSPNLNLALDFVDNSLGQLVTALKANGLLDSTQIIITAKHGQSPKNRALYHRIAEDNSKFSGSLATGTQSIVGFLNAYSAQPLAAETSDDVSLDWWQDPTNGPGNVVKALEADPNTANILSIDHVYAGTELGNLFGTPNASTNYLDPGTRVPDVIIQPTKGVVYSLSTSKIAEHGGGTMDDRNVALLVVDGSGWGHGRRVWDNVTTTQVAPTILAWLGLKPTALTAVVSAHTKVLPKH
jgi:predicted AlkP superfamily pyrophosphatase or phosphodiesterase